MRGTGKRIRTILVFALLLMAACVEPYDPPSSSGGGDMLVVDGFLNGTSKSATVKLTRAIPLSINAAYPPEVSAMVSVESEDGTAFSLSEVDEGVYKATELTLDPSAEYRLKVLTKAGVSYTSEYIELRQSPLLDSVSWRPDETGVRFFVSGHDPANKTKYYRYLFTETWEYNVMFFSYFKKTGGLPVLRDLGKDEQVYSCWGQSLNTEILTVSTKKFDTDQVSMLPINFIKKGSRQFSHIYSILVQQRAISQEEYEYWELIRKTTESLGGLFDPLPSQVVGNMHNDNDPAERILGYFSGGFVTEQRIFIFNIDLPPSLRAVDAWSFPCEMKSIPYSQPQLAGSNIFIATVGVPPTDWIIAPPNCADCTSLIGNNVKPDYWPR